MKIETFEEIVSKGEERRRALRQRKTHDYDNEEDRLASFKQVANICKELKVDVSKPSGIATVLFALKLVRDANLKANGKAPSNESREDTYDDMHNYIDLKMGCEIDEQSTT